MPDILDDKPITAITLAITHIDSEQPLDTITVPIDPAYDRYDLYLEAEIALAAWASNNGHNNLNFRWELLEQNPESQQ